MASIKNLLNEFLRRQAYLTIQKNVRRRGIGLAVLIIALTVIWCSIHWPVRQGARVYTWPGAMGGVVENAWAGVCGDGVCEDGETAADCPEDCMRFGVHKASSAQSVQGLNVECTSMQPQVWWQQLEPDEGIYNPPQVSKLDGVISAVQSAGVQPVVTLNSLSAWGTTRAWQAYEQNPDVYPCCDYPDPEDVDAWEKFVDDVVERYDGDGIKDAFGLVSPVRYWHLVEEWRAWYDTGTLEDVQRYVDLLRITYPVIKQQDPLAKVVQAGFIGRYLRYMAYVDGFINDPLAGMCNGVLLTKEQIAADARYQRYKAEVEYVLQEGKDYFDILDLHLYTWNYAWQPGILEWTKSKMSEYGYSKPMMCIEAGGPLAWSDEAIPQVYTDKINAEYVIKLFTTAFSNGVRAYSWGLRACAPGQWMCDHWGERFRVIQLIDNLDLRKPSFYTYGLMTSKLKGFSLAEKVDLGGDSHVYRFTVNNQFAFVGWNDAVTATVDLSQHLSTPTARVTPIVTELDENNNPVYPDAQIVPADSVPLTEIPVFIERVA